jgi:hypothetical protein
METLDLLCIADRENMRVVCSRAGLLPYATAQPFSITGPDLGRVFGVTAAGAYLRRRVKWTRMRFASDVSTRIEHGTRRAAM